MSPGIHVIWRWQVTGSPDLGRIQAGVVDEVGAHYAWSMYAYVNGGGPQRSVRQAGASDTLAMGRLLTVTGTAATIAEYRTVSPFSGAWRGANGLRYAMGHHPNGATGPLSLAMENAAALRALGRVAGIAGVGLSLIDAGQHLRQGNRSAAAKSGLDAAFGVAGTAGGPYGSGAAVLYFGVDMTVGWPAVGRQINEHPMMTGVTPSPLLF